MRIVMCYIHRELQTLNRKLRGRKRAGGNSLEREGLLDVGITHALISLVYRTYTPTGAGFFF